MPCIDGKVFRQRILAGLLYYQSEAQKDGQILHPQRIIDIEVLTRFVHVTPDETLLEKEIKIYLQSLPMPYSLFKLFSPNRHRSRLREILNTIMHDENRKYNLYALWLISDGGMIKGTKPVDEHVQPPLLIDI